MPDELTEELVAQIKESLKENGYNGQLRKTKIGGDTYLYRAVTREEYEAIISELSLKEDATQQDLTYALVLEGTVYPALEEDDFSKMGMGVPYTLEEKVKLLSGVLEDPITHYLQDETISSYGTWAPPTTEEKKEISDKYEKEPTIQVRETSIMGFPFVYRNLLGKEYAALVKDAGQGEEVLYKTLGIAVLWPKIVGWDSLPAFIAPALQQKVFILSGVETDSGIEDDEEV